MSPDARLRMKISWGISLPPLIASGLLVLSMFSGGALAADAAAPQPHWSGLPIWGVEAEAGLSDSAPVRDRRSPPTRPGSR